jgi:hypothetical protein
MIDDDECGQSVEWSAGKTEVPGENLSQCHLVHHKSYITDISSRDIYHTLFYWSGSLAWSLSIEDSFQGIATQPPMLHIFHWFRNQLQSLVTDRTSSSRWALGLLRVDLCAVAMFVYFHKRNKTLFFAWNINRFVYNLNWSSPQCWPCGKIGFLECMCNYFGQRLCSWDARR